jgi:uncharacterized protein (TIGR03086 family)
LHRQAGALLIATVEQVQGGHLHLPTPCTEWDVRELIHHIAWSNLWVAPLVEGRRLDEVEPELAGDVLGEDPIGAALRSIDESSMAFEKAGTDSPVQISRGTVPASEYCFERMNDLSVHNWDLATAIGVPVDLDPECMRTALDGFRPLEAMLRPMGALGPDVEAPPGADLQTRYLAFFGRRTGWTPPSG